MKKSQLFLSSVALSLVTSYCSTRSDQSGSSAAGDEIKFDLVGKEHENKPLKIKLCGLSAEKIEAMKAPYYLSPEPFGATNQDPIKEGRNYTGDEVDSIVVPLKNNSLARIAQIGVGLNGAGEGCVEVDNRPRKVERDLCGYFALDTNIETHEGAIPLGFFCNFSNRIEQTDGVTWDENLGREVVVKYGENRIVKTGDEQFIFLSVKSQSDCAKLRELKISQAKSHGQLRKIKDYLLSEACEKNSFL